MQLRIVLMRRTPRYTELFDVCQFLADEYGGAPNALAVMARQSGLYQDALSRMRVAQLESGTAAIAKEGGAE